MWAIKVVENKGKHYDYKIGAYLRYQLAGINPEFCCKKYLKFARTQYGCYATFYKTKAKANREWKKKCVCQACKKISGPAIAGLKIAFVRFVESKDK